MKDMSKKTPACILKFWFGEAEDDAAVNAEKAPLWWGKNPQQDAQITAEFADSLRAAAAGELDEWVDSAQSCLALIIALDQFPRVIYRDTPEAFGCDAKAREICEQGLAKGLDRELRDIERIFFYLPLEHSEALADQDHSIRRYEELAGSAIAELFQVTLDFAHAHRDIIMKFGRFPHRNAILGRESTVEELEFLSQPGSSF